MPIPPKVRSIVDWIDHRTGLETAIRDFLYEEIPESSGWHQVFGSIALFSFMVQAFTGILLAFNYAPTPGDAYNSVRYITLDLTGGALVRGLHHWGASLMIIVVVIHMTQVFISGGYKKPREATWLAGCVLLLTTFAFGLTGYLLPWDNRAYWGTVVTTQIAASAPVLGQYMQRLMGGSDGVGVVTFTRFYAMHVMILPLSMIALIGIHVYLVRKHGVAPVAGDVGPKKRFFPEQVFKDTLAIFAVFTVLFVLALVARAPLGRLADPTDTSYIPRPEWYFLFLFQTLKLFEGPLEVVGAVILPNLAILALFLVPFIDRGRAIKTAQRTVAIGVVVLAGLAWAGLTAAAIRSTPAAMEDTAGLEPDAEPWQLVAPSELAAVGYFRMQNCGKCHAGGKVTTHKTSEELIAHFKQATTVTQLSDSQLKALANVFIKMNPNAAAALLSAPQPAVDGAMVYEKSHCGICHQVNGVGVKLGPELNGVALRRNRDWLIQHFLDPQRLSPGSTMPRYRFSPKDMEAIVAYLHKVPN